MSHPMSLILRFISAGKASYDRSPQYFPATRSLCNSCSAIVVVPEPESPEIITAEGACIAPPVSLKRSSKGVLTLLNCLATTVAPRPPPSARAAMAKYNGLIAAGVDEEVGL